MTISVAWLAAALALISGPALAQTAGTTPQFQVEPFWPKPLPNNWILGQVSGIATDRLDRIWVVHRRDTLNERERAAEQNPPTAKCCVAAPPVLLFDQSGNLLKSWGGPGTEPGDFGRIRALALGPDGLLYVCDCTDHRIQVFSREGELVRCWGQPGSEPGMLSYPSDLAFNRRGDLYVVERGNNRVQKFTKEGQSLGCWGGPGREPGRLNEPWALVVDSRGRVHVIDTENHRVQRIDF